MDRKAKRYRLSVVCAAVTLFLGSTGATAARGAASLTLDGDTDRNGIVDGSAAERSRKSYASVIVICNCDRDEPASLAGPSQPDCFDRIVNGAEDWKDLEPLILRRSLSPPEAEIWLRIENGSLDDVELGQRIRVFNDRGREVLGPSGGDSYHLSAAETASLADGDLTYYAEGLSFATSVRLSVLVGPSEQDYLSIETAPLILTPQTQRPRAVYVARPSAVASSATNLAYVERFRKAAASCGAAVRLLPTREDAWIEDEIAWGYTESPRRRLDVVFHFPRNEELTGEVRKLLGPDLGWCEAYDDSGPSGDSLNHGGNVEVAPPTPAFPLGRIYYGSIAVHDDPLNSYLPRRFDARLHAFFVRQGVQPPIELHTNWLAVGHIDEVAAFVPRGDAPGSLLLLASPKLGFDLLGKLDRDAELDARYRAWIAQLHRVEDFFSATTLGRSLRQYNIDVDERIFGSDHAAPSPSSIKGILKSELGLAETDILEVPAVFFNDAGPAFESRWGARAIIPCAANSCPLGRTLLVADMLLPAFRDRVEADLQSYRLVPAWLDDWALHVPYGGVHCNSSVRREAFTHRWWENREFRSP
ncbi:MAG: hypothetical protein HUU20_08380 [Pirellulales bacterium]|nr:hypothetical protein [Pirellulales bacterium]